MIIPDLRPWIWIFSISGLGGKRAPYPGVKKQRIPDPQHYLEHSELSAIVIHGFLSAPVASRHAKNY